MTANNSEQQLYHTCLIPYFPEEVQHQVRDFSNYIVRPLGIILAVMSFACNSLVIFTVTRTRSLQKPSALMKSSLAVTDLIYSPYSLLKNVTEMFANEFMCPVEMDPGITEYGFGIVCNIATLGTLAIISRDRHLAVREPHLYQIYMTKSRAIKMICAPWLLSIIMLLTTNFLVL